MIREAGHETEFEISFVADPVLSLRPDTTLQNTLPLFFWFQSDEAVLGLPLLIGELSVRRLEE